MAIYFSKTKDDRKSIYDTIEKWKNECLLNDKSLLWEGEQIWTLDNITRFKRVFVDDPDESADSFDQKFEKQLANESKEIYQLAIELMYIYFIYPYPGSITYETKIRKLEMIASWNGIQLDISLPIYQVLKEGIGSPGTFYTINKYYELSYLVRFAEELKNLPVGLRKEVLSNPRELKKIAETVRSSIGKKVQIQNIVLHLLLPEKFERIANWGHKSKIVKTYAELLQGYQTEDIDEQLYIIREKLEKVYDVEKFDFYSVKEVYEHWNETKRSEKRVKDSLSSDDPLVKVSIFDNSTNINDFTNGLIFENVELLFDQITTALANGKHIILTGPPGTGKSKLAKKICELYNVPAKMVTASSNWSTFETIGGYRPNKDGSLYFHEGIFLECVKDKDTLLPKNEWLIIDEINRADIDKAFGTLFSVLTGDAVTLPYQSKSGKTILIKPEDDTTAEPNDYEYVIPKDWRIIGTMNTEDKVSLYEMSYAFMRRFAFIPVGIPKVINSELIKKYLSVWGIETYPNPETLGKIWEITNQYRKIGPAIIEDIAKHTQGNDDFTSPIILYVLPQFEGFSYNKIKEFIEKITKETDAVINQEILLDFAKDFFNAGDYV